MNRVVAAAIVDSIHGRLLLVQRDPLTSYAWHWCTPGGKVEDGETDRDALARELLEELGVEMIGDVGRLAYTRSVVSTRTGKTVEVVCYVVPAEQLTQKPTPKDGTVGVGWFDAFSIVALELTPADEAERAALLGLLAQSHDGGTE